jgi:hypothetical protein
MRGNGMKMLLRTILFSAIIAVTLFSLSYAIDVGGPKTPTPPPPPVQPKVPETKITIPDNPRIQEFTANPSMGIHGGHVTFRWRVDTGPGGSPINRIRITFGAIEIHTSSSPNGEYRFTLQSPIVPDEPRSLQFVLTAFNQAGRSTIKTVDVRQMSKEEVFGSLRIHLEADPREFRARQSIEFEIYFTIPLPSGPMVAMPFEIPVEGIVLKQGSRIAGRAVGIRLPGGGTGPPVPQEGRYKIRDTGFTGSQEDYVVEIAYRGRNKQQRFRIRPLVFSFF